jgi:hypothetical protein
MAAVARRNVSDFLGTASEARLLDEDRREAFLAAIAHAIDAHGEPVIVPMRTRLCLARRG